MALTFQEYTADGANKNFSYAFLTGKLLPTDVVSVANQLKVYVNSVLQVGNYTVNTALSRVEFVTAPAFGLTVRISRVTNNAARYVNYTNASNLNASLLNVDANHLFFLIQELADGQTFALTKDTDGIWDAKGIRIKNGNTAVDSTDFVTFGQMTAAMSGTVPITVGGNGYDTFLGDGVITERTLASPAPLGRAAQDYWVFYNGLRQSPYAAYTVDSTGATDKIVFSPAPPSGHQVEIYWVTGVLSGVVADASVDNDSIAPFANIAVNKLAAGTDSYVLVTVAGVPTWVSFTSSLVSNFASAVQAFRPEQLTAPTGSFSMNSQKITNLATPTVGTDAANKNYVDAQAKRQLITTLTYAGVNLDYAAPWTIGAYIASVDGGSFDEAHVSGCFNGNNTHDHGASKPDVTRVSGSTIRFQGTASGTIRVILFEE